MTSQSASARKPAEKTEPFKLTVTRRLKAPRALVFKMFTDPTHLVRWFGPEGHTCTECAVEPKVGGRFYAAMRGSDGVLRRVQGIFQTVTPDQGMAFTWSWLDDSGMPRDPALQTLVTITLEAKGEETELTLLHTGFADANQAGMHEQGWNGCFVCLAQYLDGLPA
jgi:uncharacterized protein YndB with AHSA1/START domain